MQEASLLDIVDGVKKINGIKKCPYGHLLDYPNLIKLTNKSHNEKMSLLWYSIER